MASRNVSRIVAALAWLGAAPLGAQAPTPVRLSFADAVRRAAGTAPVVELATLRTDEAQARVQQTRSALLPGFSVGAGWVNRTFNSRSLGITFPTPPGVKGLPTLIPPFDNVDARLRLTQTVVDLSSLARVRAARAQVTGSAAEGSAVSEGAAAGAAFAYLRAARATSVVAARQADSSIAAELVGLAQAQKAAGVSAAIDVTRARTQLVVAEGALIVARNQSDRARIDLARTLGIDPATPLALADTLAAALPHADVPATRDTVVAMALARRPDVEADYGVNGLTPGSSIATRQVAVQVTIPILDGFRREGRTAEQEAVVRETEVRARDLRQQIVADVDGALLDLASAEAQQAIAAERLKLANDELAQARERFKAGVAGNIEVIDAQSSLLRARDTDIDARSAAATARVALARAAGVARSLH